MKSVISCLAVLLVILQTCFSLNLIDNQTVDIGSKPIHFTFINFLPNHIIGIGNVSDIQTNSILLQGSALNLTVLANIQIENQLKIVSIWSNYKSQSKSFLAFNETKILLYQTNAAVPVTVYEISYYFERIISTCFGNSSNQIFFLMVNQNFRYSLLFYRNLSLVCSQQLFTISISKALKNIHFASDKIFLTFESALICFKILESGQLEENRLDTFITSNIAFIDSTINSQFYFMANMNSLYIWNISSLQLYKQKSGLGGDVLSIAVRSPYVFVQTDSSIQQFDYSQSSMQRIQIVHPVWLDSSYLMRYYPPKKQLVLFQTSPTIHFLSLSFEYSYECNSNPCSCNPGYVQVNSNCELDPIPKEEDWIIEPKEKSNSTEEQKEKEKQTTFLNLIPEYILTPMTESTGKILSFCSMRITPSFLLSFTGFLDDIWMYKYHRNNYPSSLEFFTNEIDIVNQLRLSPWFLDFLSFFNEQLVCNYENERMRVYLQFTTTDPQSVYFLNSAEDTYKGNLLMNFIFIVILRIILFAFTKINNFRSNQNREDTSQKSYFDKFIRKVIKSLKSGSRQWIFLTSVVQVNMLKLTFDCFLQLLHPSSFQFIDKLNFIFALTILFILLTYCICFYPLVFESEKETYAETLLTKSTYELRSFYFESVFIVSRNFVRSVFHSFFIKNYKVQICLLSFSDFLFFCFGIKMRKQFSNKVIAILTLTYSFAFFAFDTYFAILTFLEPIFRVTFYEELISLILLMTLSGIAILISIVLLIVLVVSLIIEVKRSCRSKMEKSLKILPEPFQMKNKNLKFAIDSTKPNRPNGKQELNFHEEVMGKSLRNSRNPNRVKFNSSTLSKKIMKTQLQFEDIP